MQQPLVSVIIPSYNHARFIGKAIQSVVDQTYSHHEIIVVDNHSTDDTRVVVDGFADKADIRFLSINNDGIIAASRNLGISSARGEWLAFLDSDDCWYPHKLEAVMTAVFRGADSCDVVCHDEVKVYEGSDKRAVLHHGPNEADFYRCLLTEGNRLSTSATVIRRDFMLDHQLAFNESREFVTVEDYALWLDLARAGARFRFIDEVLGEYFIHAHNHSGSLQRHWQNNENLIQHHLYEIQQFSQAPDQLWAGIKARLRLSQMKQALQAGRLILAGKVLGRILIDSPAATFSYLAKRLQKSST